MNRSASGLVVLLALLCSAACGPIPTASVDPEPHPPAVDDVAPPAPRRVEPLPAQELLAQELEILRAARRELAVRPHLGTEERARQRALLDESIAALAGIQTRHTAAAATRIETLFLGLLLPVETKVGYGHLEVYNGTVPAGTADVLVDGAICQRYIYAHAASRLVYAIPPGARRFTAVGTRRTSSPGNFRFLVLVDGEQQLRSSWLDRCPGRQVPIDLTLPAGARRLELIVDAGHTKSYDHSVWAEPCFHGVGMEARRVDAGDF